MIELIVQYEAMIRMSVFVVTFLIMAFWEILKPFRDLNIKKMTRWFNNIALVVVNTVIVRLLFPTAAVGMAVLSQEQGWGLLLWLDLPLWISIFIFIVLADLTIYGQHLLAHIIPWFWQVHRVHHTDLDYDLTTGSRFHPIEIVVSMLVKFSIIVLLGPPVVAVILFEILLSSAALFNHSNISFPPRIDYLLRWLIVTPDMHRIHHSVLTHETNSNYGFNLSCWDRLFGTYITDSRDNPKTMDIGISQLRQPVNVVHLWGLFRIPFMKKG